MNDLYNSRFIKNSRTIFSDAFDYDADLQLNLPQYCDDLLKIIKCSVNSFIIGNELNGNELKVFGKSKIDITYVTCGDNLIKNYETEEEFVKVITVDRCKCDNVNVITNLVKRYDNSRVINQRRIDLHISFSILVDLYTCYDCKVIDDCSELKTKKKNLNYFYKSNSLCKKYDFDEVAQLSDNNSIKSIINYYYCNSIEEIKIIKNKILVKSLLNVSLLYISDNCNEITKFETSIPISRIVDASGVDENSRTFVKACINNLFVKPKSDASGNLTMIDISGIYTLDIDIFENRNESVIFDAYSTKCKIDCQKEKSSFKSFLTDINEANTFKATVSFDNENIKKIYDLNVSIVKTEIKVNETVLIMSKLLIEAFICNSDDETMYIKTEEDLSFDTLFKGNEKVGGYGKIEIKTFDYVINSENRIDIRLDTNITATLYENTEEKLINDIVLNSEETIKRPALVVYFAKANETVWNIAKKFGSDEEMIISENDLSSQIIENPQVLLIPGV